MLRISEEGQADNGEGEEERPQQHRYVDEGRNAAHEHHHQLSHSLDPPDEAENSDRVERDEVPGHATAAEVEGDRVDAHGDDDGEHVDEAEEVGARAQEAVREKCDAELDREVEDEEAVGEEEHEGPDLRDRVGEPVARDPGLGDDGGDDVQHEQHRREAQIPRVGDDSDRAPAKGMVGPEKIETFATEAAVSDVDGARLRLVEKRDSAKADSRF